MNPTGAWDETWEAADWFPAKRDFRHVGLSGLAAATAWQPNLGDHILAISRH
jgi:hypothetical protein